MNWIDNIILGLIDKYNTNDVYALCDCLGIKIVKLCSENILLHKKDAFYYRDFNGKEIIFIKDNLPLQLERFILAHELGHALCHPDLLCAAYSIYSKGKLEKQANYFSLKLNQIKFDDFDDIEFEDMTLEQIAICIGIPYEVLEQLYAK